MQAIARRRPLCLREHAWFRLSYVRNRAAYSWCATRHFKPEEVNSGRATDVRTEDAPLRTEIRPHALYAEPIAFALEADTDAPQAAFLTHCLNIR